MNFKVRLSLPVVLTMSEHPVNEWVGTTNTPDSSPCRNREGVGRLEELLHKSEQKEDQRRAECISLLASL